MAAPAQQPTWPPNCRIFLGNLASEKTSAQELKDIFGKYGIVVEEPVMRRSFGFIQYDNPASAAAAIAAENGRLIGGVRLDMSIADNRDRNEGRKKALERKRVEREERDTRPKRRAPDREDYPPPRHDYRDDPRSRQPPPPPPPRAPAVIHVVHLQPPQRDYAVMIERAIRDLLALPVDTLYIDTLSIAQRLERSTQDGARFCIIVGPAHERKGTANIHNLRAESRTQRTLSDVPYREAVDYIAREMRLPLPHWSAPTPASAAPPIDNAALTLLLQLAASGAAAPQAPPPVAPAGPMNPNPQLSALAAFLSGQGAVPQPAQAYAPPVPAAQPAAAPNLMSTLLNLAQQSAAPLPMSAHSDIPPAYTPTPVPPPQPQAPADALALLQNLLKKPAAAPAPSSYSQLAPGQPVRAGSGDPRHFSATQPAAPSQSAPTTVGGLSLGAGFIPLSIQPAASTQSQDRY